MPEGAVGEILKREFALTFGCAAAAEREAPSKAAGDGQDVRKMILMIQESQC